jgi:DNA-binding transcriptional LysR family regulator
VPVIAEFLARYPDIDKRLMHLDRVVHLLEEHVDVAIRIGHLPDSALVATGIGAVRRVVCASPDYLDVHGVPAQPRDLSGKPCITFEGLDPAGSWCFGAGKTGQVVPIRSRLVTSTAEAAISAATHGVGLTRVLSYQVADLVCDGALRLVLDAFEPTSLPVSVLHAGQTPLPLKLRAFLDFATPRLRMRIAHESKHLAAA